MDTFEDWISQRGARAALAKALQISHSAVRQWGSVVPAERVVQVEGVTGIPRESLRPDMFIRALPVVAADQDAA
jgi:DNA-binding transcriptional regulator YdaS (Cro superfamily)